jgi:hypothetical protein
MAPSIAGRKSPLVTDDRVTGDDGFFVATGITDGELMEGVRLRAGSTFTQSLVMRSRSGTLGSITSEHRLSNFAPPAPSTSGSSPVSVGLAQACGATNGTASARTSSSWASPWATARPSLASLRTLP